MCTRGTNYSADSAEFQMLDHRGKLLLAAVGFSGCSLPSYDRALWALCTWLDSWLGAEHLGMRMRRRHHVSLPRAGMRAVLFAPALGLMGCSTLLAGCATLKNTPAQDQVYAMYDKCHPIYPQFTLYIVQADGRYTFGFASGTAGVTDFVLCMSGGKSSNWVTGRTPG